MHTNHHTDRTTCPCCGPTARTVADALAVTSGEQLVATADRLAFRPMYHPASRRVLLVEVATNQPVLSWCPHEARALVQEVLAGPYAATLCMDTPRGTTVTFANDELVALAVALDQVADELDPAGRADGVGSHNGPRPSRSRSTKNRAARRAKAGCTR